MKGISIQHRNVILGDISTKTEHLLSVQEWYNDVNGYGLATGNHRIMSINNIMDDLMRIEASKNEFICGIFSNHTPLIIGIVKVALYYEIENQQIAWIKSLLVDKRYRRKGFATCSVKALEIFCRQSLNIKQVCVSVANENTAGKRFWLKNNYNERNIIKTDAVIEKKGVIILSKML